MARGTPSVPRTMLVRRAPGAPFGAPSIGPANHEPALDPFLQELVDELGASVPRLAKEDSFFALLNEACPVLLKVGVAAVPSSLHIPHFDLFGLPHIDEIHRAALLNPVHEIFGVECLGM